MGYAFVFILGLAFGYVLAYNMCQVRIGYDSIKMFENDAQKHNADISDIIITNKKDIVVYSNGDKSVYHKDVYGMHNKVEFVKMRGE